MKTIDLNEFTLNDAIEHAKEASESCEDEKCSIQHRQLAVWLAELKARRERDAYRNMNDSSNISRLLSLADEGDFIGTLFWKYDNHQFNFFINCNDIFYGSASDAVEIKTTEDLDLLEECVNLVDDDNPEMLFCCRKKKMKPPKDFFKYIDKNHWKYFDECEIKIGEN